MLQSVHLLLIDESCLWQEQRINLSLKRSVPGVLSTLYHLRVNLVLNALYLCLNGAFSFGCSDALALVDGLKRLRLGRDHGVCGTS